MARCLLGPRVKSARRNAPARASLILPCLSKPWAGSGRSFSLWSFQFPNLCSAFSFVCRAIHSIPQACRARTADRPAAQGLSDTCLKQYFMVNISLVLILQREGRHCRPRLSDVRPHCLSTGPRKNARRCRGHAEKHIAGHTHAGQKSGTGSLV